jgi:hypothetical protein
VGTVSKMSVRSTMNSQYRVCARNCDGTIELHVDLMNLRGEWVEVFQSTDADDIKRYLRTRTDPGADIIWEVA